MIVVAVSGTIYTSQFVVERIVSHDVDGIQIKPKSRHIRCSLRDYDDGLIDITNRALR